MKLIVKGLREPRVTIRYPAEPHPVPEDFRGRVELDAEACMGCGACANVCPPEAITIEDHPEKGVRVVKVFYGRCIFCGRCEECCPVQAIRQTSDYELSTTSRDKLELSVEHKLVVDENGHALEYTVREVAQAREILSHAFSRELVDKILEYSLKCVECRRLTSLTSIGKAYRPGIGE